MKYYARITAFVPHPVHITGQQGFQSGDEAYKSGLEYADTVMTNIKETKAEWLDIDGQYVKPKAVVALNVSVVKR